MAVVIDDVLQFLACRTPQAWVSAAAARIDILLLDHALLELKAAQQAQKLMWRYGLPQQAAGSGIDDSDRVRLLNKMSRLAREELRHFEQVLSILEERGVLFSAIPASRYAARLHEHVHNAEPRRVVDTLIVGAIIEARSCERFYSLLPALERPEPEIAAFYRSLLRSESRHFKDYLELANDVANGTTAGRIDEWLQIEQELILSEDAEFRFHSGIPPVPEGDARA